MSRAKPFDESNLSRATEWDSIQDLNENFKYVRDLKFLRWKGRERRTSWLYPDDGCYARAALAVKNLFQEDITVPDKIFVFGNLRLKTRNSLRGYVTWWYHVAPIVKVEDEYFVLDPSVHSSEPLPLKNWLSRIGNISKLKVAICSSGTYGPRSNCGRKTDGKETAARNAQGKYLNLEWNRLINLGRNPERELGDFPPWSDYLY